MTKSVDLKAECSVHDACQACHVKFLFFCLSSQVQHREWAFHPVLDSSALLC